MTLSELKDRLEQIKSLGFVRTHRNGDTGIGKTLEDLLNIKENNIPLPDIGEIGELKTYRKKAGSMLTLFTLEPQPKGGDRDRILLDHLDIREEATADQRNCTVRFHAGDTTIRALN